MRDGKLVVVSGASGSGKSLYTKQQIKNARRVLVWDIEGEYAKEGFNIITDRRVLLQWATHKGDCKLAYQSPRPDAKLFDWFCRLAFVWGRVKPGVIVVEELADVTTPGKAPDGWGVLVRRARKYGIDRYAITQRPAESDKTTIGNASEMVCFRMSRAQDRAYMSAELDTQLEQVTELQKFEYIHRNTSELTNKKQKIQLPPP